MKIDPLIGRLLSRVYRRVLDFDESPTGTDLPAPATDRSYLLYLHIPYCVVLCPFCSFHRVEFKERNTQSYFDCLRQEIDMVSDAGFRFDELYVGGGTPTVMPGELIKTLAALSSRHTLSSISVETNPDDLESAGLAALRDAGVNRLSVGVQSFDDASAPYKCSATTSTAVASRHAKDRLHDAPPVVFDTLNVDMIFNLAGTGREASLRRDLGYPHRRDVGARPGVLVSPDELTASTRKKTMQADRWGRVNYSRERAALLRNYYRTGCRTPVIRTSIPHGASRVSRAWSMNTLSTGKSTCRSR